MYVCGGYLDSAWFEGLSHWPRGKSQKGKRAANRPNEVQKFRVDVKFVLFLLIRTSDVRHGQTSDPLTS
jgi:hypothetical protein